MFSSIIKDYNLKNLYDKNIKIKDIEKYKNSQKKETDEEERKRLEAAFVYPSYIETPDGIKYDIKNKIKIT